MTDRKRKRGIICLASSSSSSTEEEEEVEEEEEEEEEDGVSSDCSYNSEDYEDSGEEEEECEGDENGGSGEEEEEDDDESLCKTVIALLREGDELECLNLKMCKAYLRVHGLRLAGTKAVCIMRIKDHWRIKDGKGEAYYPRSSFVINCTGDVCKGDVVLFTQRVYNRFNKVTRHGKVLGKRFVAGRVVKESYGSAKQQHTFTVEVLWSKGFKKLPPLSPLLVKGRNLYKLKTFRQRWNNEAERIKVLDEKHERGAAARLARAMKKSKKLWPEHGVNKKRRPFSHMRPIPIRKKAEPERGKDILHRHRRFKGHQQDSLQSTYPNFKRNARSEYSKMHGKHNKLDRPGVDRGPIQQSYAFSSQDPYLPRTTFPSWNVPAHFSASCMGSTSTMSAFPPFRPYADGPYRNGTSYDYSGPSYSNKLRNSSWFPRRVDFDRSSHQLS